MVSSAREHGGKGRPGNSAIRATISGGLGVRGGASRRQRVGSRYVTPWHGSFGRRLRVARAQGRACRRRRAPLMPQIQVAPPLSRRHNARGRRRGAELARAPRPRPRPARRRPRGVRPPRAAPPRPDRPRAGGAGRSTSGFVLYGGWDGGRVGGWTKTGLTYAVGQVAYVVPIALVGWGAALMHAAVHQGAGRGQRRRHPGPAVAAAGLRRRRRPGSGPTGRCATTTSSPASTPSTAAPSARASTGPRRRSSSASAPTSSRC